MIKKKSMRKKSVKSYSNRTAFIAGSLLVSIGIIILLSPLFLSSFSVNTSPLYPNPVKKAGATPQHIVRGVPTKLLIPSLNYDLTAIDGSYDKNTGQWTLTNDKVQFALQSKQPNNSQGTTLIYGHNRKEVFAKLERIKPGAEASIITDNGYIFNYRYQDTYATSPDDLSVFNDKGYPTLILQTCSGAWFQNRQMYRFEFVSYKAA